MNGVSFTLTATAGEMTPGYTAELQPDSDTEEAPSEPSTETTPRRTAGNNTSTKISVEEPEPADDSNFTASIRDFLPTVGAL